MTTVAIIGCTHAGTYAVNSILEQHPDWQVDVFERGDTVSFLSSGIALWVGDHLSDPERMFYSSPEALTKAGAHMHMHHEVTAVDVKRMTLTAKDLSNGKDQRYAFDKLVITTGSIAAQPSIQGLDELRDNGRIMLCKSYEDGRRIVERSRQVKSVIVVGAGYIGSELAEQFSTRGIKTTLIDALPHILDHNYDSVVTDAASKAFKEHNVTLAMGQKVIAFRPGKGSDGGEDSGVTVVTEFGEYTADFAIMSVGLVPNTQLVAPQLNTLGYGAIIVDEYMRASNPEGEVLGNVFAAGDCATAHFNPTGTEEYWPLVSSAIRQARLIGANIEEPTVPYMGTQATTAVQLYDLSLASTGMTLDFALRRHKDAVATTIEEDYRPDFMPSTTPVRATLVWEKGNRHVLGAQFAARHDISMAANAVSVAIQAGFTIDQLAGTDMLFQPNFDQPVNFVNALAMKAIAEHNAR